MQRSPTSSPTGARSSAGSGNPCSSTTSVVRGTCSSSWRTGRRARSSSGTKERWTEIDVGPFEPLLDERGILAGAEFPFSPPDPDEQREHLRQIVNWFWHELSHFVTALGRGDLWWAYGQLEALRGHCVNLMRIQHGAEAQDEPYEKLAKAIPVSELASLRTTFCPMEREAMLDAAREIVRFFREHAPRVAEANGSEYPSTLAQLMFDRLESL